MVIVGAGVAGVTAARAVRQADPDVEIDLFAREPYLYYYRPRLPDVVAGEVEPDEIVAYPQDWYDSQHIRVHLSEEVVSVDTSAGAVLLDGGRRVEYGSLLVATGADPFIPPIDGAGNSGFLSLRTIDDALAIRERAANAKEAVVIGGGLLGLEAGRGLQRAGLDVTVLEGADWLLPRQLDAAAASVLLQDVDRLGIKVKTGASVSRIEGQGHVTGVTLADGTSYPAGIVLCSTGVRSTVGFLDGSGLEVGRGVVVDPRMKTNVPDVYAAGDVATLEGMVGGNIPVAISQAEAAAGSITKSADAKPARAVSYNTLKIVGIDVFSAGATECHDTSCVERVYEDRDAGIYRKVVLQDGVISGAMVVGSRTGVSRLNTLVQSRADIGRWSDSIAREDFDFSSIS